ncbi:MAG: energy transducer TonB [Flavobacteriales bacterium]
MKSLLLSLSILVQTNIAIAQQPVPTESVGPPTGGEVAPVPPIEDPVYDLATVQMEPEFPGGQVALMSYISSHIIYPTEAVEASIEGKVHIEFVVARDGRVKDVTLKRGVNSLLDNEALHVVRGLPAFKPGMMNDRAVAVRYLLPIVFKLT